MSDDQELETDMVSNQDDSVEHSASDVETVGSDMADASESISAKEAERLRIQAEVEAFLAQGGQITTVDTNVMTDPPKRPESNYGGQPI